jgi:hypothetical protein
MCAKEIDANIGTHLGNPHKPSPLGLINAALTVIAAEEAEDEGASLT